MSHFEVTTALAFRYVSFMKAFDEKEMKQNLPPLSGLGGLVDT